ncbi:AAA family ATPase [uncultured Mobiluncus sp.]|uniref:AAA family ATPase n=1 Tax=uncultured Mobiluncus sp. TaxID=293425 RepID=UPI0026277C5C|nr:ATP-binding protein [uncultured Mobiluncus sp.]
MEITSVKVRNWRNFKTVEFDVGKRLFMIGPNAAGKSNLMDVFRFLGDICTPGGGLTAALEKRGGAAAVRSLFARKKPNIEIDISLKEDNIRWRYYLSIKVEPHGLHRATVDEEIVEKDDEIILRRPSTEDKTDSDLLTQTHLEQISANAEFRQIAKFFASIKYLHLVPQLLRHPDITSEVFKEIYGSDLPSQVNGVQPMKTRAARLKKMAESLRAAVPQFKDLQLDIDAKGKPHLVASYENWRSHEAKQNEQYFSDGTLRLLGIVWTLISAPRSGGILLLEEPELSLNNSVVGMLPSLFAQAQRGIPTQLFISTHAPAILDDEGVDPSEVLVLQVTSDGTVANLLSEILSVSPQIDADLPLSEITNELISPRSVNLLPAALGER